jgi:predicted amidophosphoribosyltransferase
MAFDATWRCWSCRRALRDSQWQLLECVPALDGDRSFDNFIACLWQEPGGERLLIAVNYSAHRSQCYVRLSFAGLGAARSWLHDLLSDARYEREGHELQARGLYLDVPPWQPHVFDVSAA